MFDLVLFWINISTRRKEKERWQVGVINLGLSSKNADMHCLACLSSNKMPSWFRYLYKLYTMIQAILTFVCLLKLPLSKYIPITSPCASVTPSVSSKWIKHTEEWSLWRQVATCTYCSYTGTYFYSFSRFSSSSNKTCHG